MHIRLKFRSHRNLNRGTLGASWTRALVDPAKGDRKQVGKPVNDEARKALMYAKVPVPQTDTGR